MRVTAMPSIKNTQKNPPGTYARRNLQMCIYYNFHKMGMFDFRNSSRIWCWSTNLSTLFEERQLASHLSES